MKVVVFGGRAYPNEIRVEEALDLVHARLVITKLVHGAAGRRSWTGNWYGADMLAARWAVKRRVPAQAYPAAWSDLSHPLARIRQNRHGGFYDANAGFRRNQQILTMERPEFGIEFPGGPGTADMRARCLAAGIPVLTIDDTSDIRLPETVAA